MVAPSLIPKKAGDRVKTDRRDAWSLDRLHRAGELPAVWVPDGAQEALRDLTRVREDMKHLQRQAKQRLLAFLLRHGKRYDGKSKWTQTHMRWLEGVKFDQATQQIVFQEYVDTVAALRKRLDGLDGHLQSAASESVFWPVIEALMALRGVNLLTAATIVAEIGDLKRCANSPQLMALWPQWPILVRQSGIPHGDRKIQQNQSTEPGADVPRDRGGTSIARASRANRAQHRNCHPRTRGFA